MTYTINGKQYTKFDINKRCAEIDPYVYKIHGSHPSTSESAVHVEGQYGKYGNYYNVGFDPCNNWNDAGPIIDKCWDELMSSKDDRGCGTWTHWDHVKWQRLMNEHNCTKQEAACICLIELNTPD